MDIDDPITKNDVAEAKQDLREAKQELREALTQVEERVGEGIANLRPDTGIKRRPVASAFIAGALGVTVGARSRAASILGLLLFGAAIAIAACGEPDQAEAEIETEPPIDPIIPII